MNFTTKRVLAISLLLFLASGHVYFSSSFAETGVAVPGESLAATPPKLTGTLSTRGNTEVKVNGANSATGATILSGANIETGPGAGATVHLLNGGVLEIQPNTKLTVDFDQERVKVVIADGCLRLRTKQGITGEVLTAGGAIEKNDPAQEGKLDTCPQVKALPIRSNGLLSLIRSASVEVIAKGVTRVAVPVATRGVLY